jgi:hypothetical protein
MNVSHDLTQALESGDRMLANKAVKAVQDAIDEIVLANKEVLAEAEKSNKISKEYQDLNTTLAQSNIDLVNVVKNIHRILGNKIDLLQGDAEVAVLMSELGQFIMSAGSIKLGVISHAKDK